MQVLRTSSCYDFRLLPQAVFVSVIFAFFENEALYITFVRRDISVSKVAGRWLNDRFRFPAVHVFLPANTYSGSGIHQIPC
jgi:hypothetical protein